MNNIILISEFAVCYQMAVTNNEKFVNFVSLQETKASTVSIAEFNSETIVLTIQLLQNTINEMKLRLFDKHKLNVVDSGVFQGVDHKVYADGQKRVIESLGKVIQAGDNYYVDKYKLSTTLKDTMVIMATNDDEYKKVFGSMTNEEETTMVRFIILLRVFEEARNFITKFFEAFDDLEKTQQLFIESQKK